MAVAILAGWIFLTIFLYRASILSPFEAEVLLAPERCRTQSGGSATVPSCESSSGFSRGTLVELLCLAWGMALAFILWPLLTGEFTADIPTVAILLATFGAYGALSYAMWRNFWRWKFHIGVLAVLGCGALFTAEPQYLLFRFQYLHVGSQVSPLMPLLVVTLSFGWWAWFSLSGRALTDRRRPRLPKLQQGLCQELSALSAEEQQKLDRAMTPGYLDTRIWLSACVVLAAVSLLIVPHRPLRSFEHYSYDYLLIALLIGSFGLMLESAVRLVVVWNDAKCLLRSIEGQPFRWMISRVGGLSWTSIWKIGTGSLAAAHSLLTREIDSLRVACSFVRGPSDPADPAWNNVLPLEQLGIVWNIYIRLMEWRRPPATAAIVLKGAADAIAPSDPGPMAKEATECSLLAEFGAFQLQLGRSAAALMSLLVSYYGVHPEIQCELSEDSLLKLREVPPATAKEAIEYFVSLLYMNYIVTVLLRIRTLAATAVGMFVFDVIALNVYPFEPRAVLRTLLFGVFTALILCFGVVYAQMHRDPTLSRMTDTRAGELGGDYWIRMLTVTVFPLASLLATQFPAIGNFLFSWVEPAVKALR